MDYSAERIWVFNKTRIYPVAGYVRSLGVALTILGFILILTYASVHIFGMSYFGGRVFAGIVAGVVNFILDKKITFAL